MQPSTENPHAESSLIHFNSYTVGSLSRNTITMVGAAIAQPVRSNPPRVRTPHGSNIFLVFSIITISVVISVLFGKYINIYIRPSCMLALVCVFLFNRRPRARSA